jgi:chromosomal replication initiator protein
MVHSLAVDKQRSHESGLESLDQLRELSRLLFGDGDRLEVILAIARNDDEPISDVRLGHALVGWSGRRVRAQLVALESVGLLRAMSEEGAEGVWFVRQPAYFWEACTELVERWGDGSYDTRPASSSAEGVPLDGSRVGLDSRGPAASRRLEQVWARVSTEIALVVDEPSYRIWLEPLRAVELSDNRLSLVAPAHTVAWIQERFGRVIHASVRSVLGPGVAVEFGSADSNVGELAASKLSPAHSPVADSGGHPTREVLPSPMLGPTSNPKLTFDQFLVGDSNRLAHSAALAVVERPAQVYNPLFVCGPPGVGKTHLLSSIGNRLHAGNAEVVIRSTTGEAFAGELRNAVSAGGREAFRLRFRDVNALLVDDVQFLERKTETEDEFLHTFVALHDAGCQIVLTSDRPPNDLQALDARLRARLEAGLVTEIKPPDFALRVSILRSRAQGDGIVCDDEVIRMVAQRVSTNVRALEGAFIRVVAFSSLTGQPITADCASEVLDSLYPRTRTGGQQPTITEIQALVAQEFDLTPEELLSSTRTVNIAWPRQIAMYLARELTGESLPTIGREFGGRDHTTVLHAWRRTTARIDADEESRKVVQKLCRACSHPSPSNSATTEIS